jgi:SSS family solute:Na+ symporter
MLAASMSTYSAYLLAWSSVLARDVISPSRKWGLSERATVRVTRVAAVAIGLFLLLFGLWYKIPDTAFQYLYVTGAMYTAGALSCVAAGIYWKKANTPGAFAGLLMGAAAPAGFLLLEGYRHALPGWLAFVTDVNVAGLLSYLLAVGGMVFGSLATQRSHPPRAVKEGGDE